MGKEKLGPCMTGSEAMEKLGVTADELLKLVESGKLRGYLNDQNKTPVSVKALRGKRWVVYPHNA